MSKSQIVQILEHEEKSPWRVVGWWFTGFLALGAVIVVAVHAGEFQNFFEVLAGIKLQWVILASIIQSCTYVCATTIWWQVLKYSQHPISFKSLFPLNVAQLFAEQALPSSGLSGTLLVIKGLLNRGVKSHLGMGCMLVGMVSYYSAYLAIAIFSLVLVTLHQKINILIIMAIAIFAALAVGVPALVLWLRHLGHHHKLPRFIMRHTLSRPIINALVSAPVDMLKKPDLVIKTTLLQLAIFLMDIATLSVMLHATGYALPFWIVMVSFVIASVVATIGPADSSS